MSETAEHLVQQQGPVDDNAWPSQLVARVVSPGEHPKIVGYDVESDLARHYRFVEVLLATITGELPSRLATKLLDATMIYLSPATVAEAPSHAACLAQICGAGASGVLSTGAIGLAEEARHTIEEHDACLSWLASPKDCLPERYLAASPQDRHAVDRYRETLAKIGVALPILEQDPSRTAALIGGLFACGARRPEQLQLLWMMARLGAVAGEAFCTQPLSFRAYPMRLPPYRYEVPAEVNDGS